MFHKKINEELQMHQRLQTVLETTYTVMPSSLATHVASDYYKAIKCNAFLSNIFFME